MHDLIRSRRGKIGIILIVMSIFGIYGILPAFAQNEISGFVIGVQFGNNYSSGVGYLSGVNVTIYNSTYTNWTLTDSNGYYYFDPPAGGSYNINWTKSGYTNSKPSQPLGVTTNDVNRTLYLYMPNVGSFNITVLDRANGRPIPGATVSAEHGACVYNDDCPTPETDTSGNTMLGVKAEVDGSPVTHTMNVAAPGYTRNDSHTKTISEGQNKNITIYLKGKYNINGYVKDHFRCQGCPGQKIQGAFVEIKCGHKDSDPKLNWSGSYFYNDTTGSDGYYSIYYPSPASGLECNGSMWMHASATGYRKWREQTSGSAQTDVELNGTARLQGTVVDNNNKSYGLDATIKVKDPDLAGSDIIYAVNSPGGTFSFPVKDGENHTLLVTKTGYKNYPDTTKYIGNHSYGQINLTGNGEIKGTAVDEYNNSIKIASANVTFVSNGGPRYLTTTDSNGEFGLNVSSEYSYSLTFVKQGYQIKTVTGVSVGADSGNDIGNVEMRGNTEINGTLTDCYNNHQLPGNKIENASVNVMSTTGGMNNRYRVFTDYNGMYDIHIPSTINTYDIQFTSAFYSTRTISESDPTNQCLNGNVSVSGKVVDRDAVASYAEQEGAYVKVYDDEGTTYYTGTTDSDGNYTISVGDMNEQTNYSVKISKDGYTTLEYPDNRRSQAWSTGGKDYNELLGKTLVRVTVIDEYDNDQMINGSDVCVYMEEEEFNFYLDCVYKKVTNTQGRATINIRERSPSRRYNVKASKYGYSEEMVGPFSTDRNLTLELYAATTVRLRDPYATTRYEKVENASVILYYNFTQREFSYSVNQTIVNVSSTCNETQVNGINVSLLCTDCEYGFSQSVLTSGGVNNTTFYQTPVGVYNLTVNGSSVGCGVNRTQITITEGGRTHNFTKDLNYNGITVKVINMGGYAIEDANVTYLDDPSLANCTTNSEGVCSMYGIPSGANQTVRAVHDNYYNATKNYTVADNALTDHTEDPMVMPGHAGNLSVFVQGSVIEDANVTISNGTFTNSTNTTANGWANFTSVFNINNITVNGSLSGYNHTSRLNRFVEPDNLTIVRINLTENWVLAVIEDDGQPVIANVTLWTGANGSSPMVENSSGKPQTGITNSTGGIEFRRLPAGTYNLSIENQSTGVYDLTEIDVLNFVYYDGSVQEDEGPPVPQTISDNCSGSSPEGSMVKVYARWTDDKGLSFAKLQTNASGSWVNVSNTTLSGTDDWSNFTINTSEKTGMRIGWRIHANDTVNKWAVTDNQTFLVTETTLTVYVKDEYGNDAKQNGTGYGVNVTVLNNTFTNSTNASDSGAVTFILCARNYSVKVNGTMQGYGTNDSLSNIKVSPGSNTETIYINVTTLTVNVTQPDGTPITSLDSLTINKSSSDYLRNASGTTMNFTSINDGFGGGGSGDGLYVFERLLPCSACNVSIDKGGTVNNSYPVLISAGVHNITQIDPPAPDPREGLPGVDVNVTIALSSPRADSADMDNLTVTLWQEGVALNYSNLTADGNATMNDIPSGYYNVTIDGWDVGFGRLVTEDEIAVGKIVANAGKSNTYGSVSLEVNGMLTYFIRVSIPGYNMFDDIENGSSGRVGTQSLTIPMNGMVNITGNVSDTNFLDFTPSPPFDPVAFEPVNNGFVNLYRSTACSGLSSDQIRYRADVTDNGSYVLKVSPYVFGQDSTVLETYCIRSEAEGYEDETKGSYEFTTNSSEINVAMTGDSYVAGQVRDIISLDPINGSKYPTSLLLSAEGCYGSGSDVEAYNGSTGGKGNFYLSVSSRDVHTPYTNLKIDAKTEGWCEYNTGENMTVPDNHTYYLIGSQYSMVNMTVNSSAGEDMINNITITIKDTTSGKTRLLGSLPTCRYNETTGMMNCYITSGARTLTFNGSEIGYGINQTEFQLSTDNCKLQSMYFPNVLNETILNITLTSDTGEPIDNITVTMNSTTYQGVTANGSVIFERVPAGGHHFTLEGNMTDVYFFNNTNEGTLSVTDDMAGKVNMINYTLNETRFSLNVTNDTGDNVAGSLDLDFTNLRTQETWSNSTDSNGYLLRTKVKYGNISVSFNSSQLYPLGLTPPGTQYLNVTPGENENTTNNLTIPINDTEVRVRVKNSTSGLQNANVTMYLSGAIAENAKGENLTALTDSSGYVTFHHVKPSLLMGDYVYVVDANSTGYGKWNYSLSVDPEGESVTNTLSPLELEVNVHKEDGSELDKDVNISMMIGGSLASNARGQYLNATGKSATFSYLQNGNYSVLVNSSAHFSQTKNFDTENIVSAENTLNFYLSERTLNVYVRETDGSVLSDPVNITFRNTTGGQVNGTDGTVIPDRNMITNYTKFEYIPDGEYMINVSSDHYFRTDWTFNTTDLHSINNTKTFNLHERDVTVNVYYIKGSLITENVTVKIVNGSGVVKNTTGTDLSGTTSTGMITLYGVPDGMHNVSAETANYTDKNRTLDTSAFAGEGFDMYLKMPGYGYLNVSVLKGSSPLSGVSLELSYNGTVIDTGTTGSGGSAILQANVSQYGSKNLTIEASKSGYDINSTEFNFTTGDGGVDQGILTLSESKYTPPPGGSGGSTTRTTGGTIGPGGCSEDWTCTGWSECSSEGLQTRTCEDQNDCGTEKDKPAVMRTCTPSRGMEVSLGEIRVKAGRCTSVNIYVENTGEADLSNVFATKETRVPDCCTLETSKRITALGAGSRTSIPVSVCAEKEAEKGIYETGLEVISGSLKREANTTVRVTMTYPDVLEEEVDQINRTLWNMKGDLSGAQYTYYLAITNMMNSARDQIARGDLDGAETTIGEMKDLMKQIETIEGAGMPVILVIAMLPVAGALIVFLWWYKGKRGERYPSAAPEMPSRPSGPQPVMQKREPDPGAVMMLTDNLRKRFREINKSSLGEKEKYYYENMKGLLEDIVEHIRKKDFSSAMIFIENFEKYLDMLERGK